MLVSSKVKKETLSYSKDGVDFNITVRTDVKIEIKAMLEIMAKAKTDLEEILAKI